MVVPEGQVQLVGRIVVVASVAVVGWIFYRLHKPEHTYGRARLVWTVGRDLKPDRKWYQRIGDWIRDYRRYRFRRKREVPSYPPDDRGVYALAAADGRGTVHLACTGDFGSGPDSRARAVAAGMATTDPDFTVHLGDIYRMGLRHEVRRNFLGEGSGSVTWPRGAVGTLAVPGNHEYQAGGDAFFDEVLPAMEVVRNGRPGPQKTSFFCLENEHWRVIGLDTGNESVQRFGLELVWKALNKVPLIKETAWVQDHKTWLPSVEMDWLGEVLASERSEPRGLIFMSHHQVYTALDSRGGNPKPGKQVADLLPDGREAIWFHGHGHIQGTYKMQNLKGAEGFSVAARAVGHGSDVDPVDLTKRRTKKRIREYQLEYVDNRGRLKAPKGEIKSPHNGFAVLTFAGPDLKVEYFTLKADNAEVERVLSESWTVQKGVLDGPRYEAHVVHKDFIGPEWIATNIGG